MGQLLEKGGLGRRNPAAHPIPANDSFFPLHNNGVGQYNRSIAHCLAMYPSKLIPMLTRDIPEGGTL
jgi:hypothetical protein